MGQDRGAIVEARNYELAPEVDTTFSNYNHFLNAEHHFMEKATSSLSICSDSSLPVTIDLTGPLPVIGVLQRDGTERKQETFSERKFNRLIREASQLPVMPILLPVCSEIEEDSSPSLFTNVSDMDPELIKEGKEFIRRNFFAIIIAHLISVAFLLGIKPIQALLLRTGSIHKKENTLKRYLSLILSIKNLYECDLVEEERVDNDMVNDMSQDNCSSGDTKPIIKYNEKSITGQELHVLRRALVKVSKNYPLFVPPPIHTMKLDQEEHILLQALKEDLDLLTLNIEHSSLHVDTSKGLDKIYTTVNPDVPLSQYDMTMLQFAFFGFLSLFPQTFGIHETSKKYPKGLSGFLHVWAVLGKRLGIDDRFNLCLNRNFDSETNLRIFKEIFLFSFKLADDNLIKLWRTMTAGSCRYFFFFRTKAMLQFMLKGVAQVNDCQHVYRLMNYFEKFCYYAHQFCVVWLLRFWVTRTIINICARTVFSIAYKIYIRRIKLRKKTYEFNRDIIVKTIY